MEILYSYKVVCRFLCPEWTREKHFHVCWKIKCTMSQKSLCIGNYKPNTKCWHASYSLNKPSTITSARGKKAHTHIPTQEIHHQTINVFFVFVACFFFVSSSTPTINIIPRVRMAAFFPAIATPSTLSHVDVVDVPPNRYTNTKCVNVAFCTTIFLLHIRQTVS